MNTQQDRAHKAETPTRYRLSCGHSADVWGPCGAPTGRAWCSVCSESAETLPGGDR